MSWSASAIGGADAHGRHGHDRSSAAPRTSDVVADPDAAVELDPAAQDPTSSAPVPDAFPASAP
ncbi:hypothetical protein [Cellulosimicrobium sp. NPDC057127]|uniref:hypothetical protein n=1 Tax=Cellulosimicrobium sp. NPDC057127 TaxID=3346026 RepID=UPI0036374FCF